MAYERLKQTALPQALADVVADVADLFQKEIRFAREEISTKLASKLQASVWMLLGILVGLIAVILVAEALVFGIASYGIAIHWSCLIVSGILLVVAALFFLKGRADAKGDLMPTQTLRQIKRDISVAKEQLI